MMPRTPTFPLRLTLAVLLALSAPGLSGQAVASDETHDTEITIQAPLDAASCDTVPATITVLGLTVDVGTARIETTGSTTDPSPGATPEPGDDGSHSHGGGARDPLPGGCYYYCPTPPSTPVPTPTAPSTASAAAGCAALIVGQPIEVTLASDDIPLIAVQVKQDANTDARVKLEAALQDIDPAAQTITALGLTIDVAGAELSGADDDSTDNASQPIDFSQLTIGQFVEARLAAAAAPLRATELEVKNFSNEVEMEVEDENGDAVHDVDDDDNPANDVEVHITETIGIPNPTATTPRRVKRILHLHTASNGTIVLNGLATGHAKIEVTRIHDGAVTHGHRRFAVRSNTTRLVHVRLR